MQVKRFKRGLNVYLDGLPVQNISDSPSVGAVTLFGPDYRGLRAKLLVKEGDQIATGSPLFIDKKIPKIRVTSPVSGRIRLIKTGARRRLSLISIEKQEGDPVKFHVSNRSIVELLCESGLWARIIVRPFGGIPDPSVKADALFVSAFDTASGAPDLSEIVASRKNAFIRGLDRLHELTDGLVYVSVSRSFPSLDMPDHVKLVRMKGRHPLGLPGTQIDMIQPLRTGMQIWQMDAQDVIALGDLLSTGVVPGERVISLAGSGLKSPRLVKVPIGAHVEDVLAGELEAGSWRILSGPPIGGRESIALRRGHSQISVLPRMEENTEVHNRGSFFGLTGTKPSSIIPTRALDLSIGPDIPVVPLLRALSVGDIETANRLRAWTLLEEDMALATYATGGKQDFGDLLRNVLDQIEDAV